MGKTIAIVLGCLWSTVATAQATFNPRGQWLAVMPAIPSYAATVLIDSERRVTWDARWDPKWDPKLHPGGVTRSRGYVQFDNPTMDIIKGDGVDAGRLRCIVQSSDLLHCRGVRSDDKIGALSILTRVGPGPTTLLSGRK